MMVKGLFGHWEEMGRPRFWSERRWSSSFLFSFSFPFSVSFLFPFLSGDGGDGGDEMRKRRMMTAFFSQTE